MDVNQDMEFQPFRRYPSLYKVDTQNLDEFYFDFLLQDGVINLGIYSQPVWPIIVKRMREIGHGFHSVHFSFDPNALPRADLITEILIKDVLCYLPNVKTLYLGEYCNDSILALIVKYCKKLEKLCIDNSEVTDEGLMSLCPVQSNENNYPQLKYISLRNVNKKNGITYLLQNMPSLEEIIHPRLRNILLDLNGHNPNRQYNLTSLELRDYLLLDYNGTLGLFSQICPNIKKLSLILIRIEHIELLSNELNFPQLEDLCIHNYDETMDLNNFLQTKGETLQKMHLRNFKFSVANLITSCPQLEVLYLQDIRFQSIEPNMVLENLINLKEFHLINLNFNDNHTRQSIISIVIPNQNNENINRSLEYLEFFCCSINVDFLNLVLPNFSNLRTLALNGCRDITDEDIDYLKSTYPSTYIIWTNEIEYFSSDSSEAED